MIYKAIKRNGKWCSLYMGFEVMEGDYYILIHSEVPTLFTDISLERLKHLGVSTENVEIVNVKVIEE